MACDPEEAIICHVPPHIQLFQARTFDVSCVEGQNKQCLIGRSQWCVNWMQLASLHDLSTRADFWRGVSGERFRSVSRQGKPSKVDSDPHLMSSSID